MTGYSAQPWDLIFVEGYEFLSFAKSVGKNIGKNISKNLSGKYSRQKLLDHVKQSATDAFKTSSKMAIQKTGEATGDWYVIKLLIKSQKLQNIKQQNNS